MPTRILVDVRYGVREGHGSPMRRAAEHDYVTSLTQIGIGNVSSTAREGYEHAIDDHFRQAGKTSGYCRAA